MKIVRRTQAQKISQLGEIEHREYYHQGRQILDPGGGIAGDYYNIDTSTIFPFTAGLVSIQIIPMNPLRVYLVVQNTSAANIFINFGQAATLTNALRLPAAAFYEQVGVGGGRNVSGSISNYGGSFITSDSLHIIGSAAGLSGVVIEGIRPAFAGF